jgi:hypothetical protein
VPSTSAPACRLIRGRSFSSQEYVIPYEDDPFENLSVQCGTTPSNSSPSIQRPLARHRVLLSRRVVAYYGLIRASAFLPATYGFAAGSASPKELGLGWESRGSPIYSEGLGSRAASLTPVARRVRVAVASPPVSAFTRLLKVRRPHWSFRGCRVHFKLRPASWLALLSRTFTFELALAGSPRTSVEYDYVGKQSIPTTGLSPASPTALWAAGHRLILALFQLANLSTRRAG